MRTSTNCCRLTRIISSHLHRPGLPPRVTAAVAAASQGGAGLSHNGSGPADEATRMAAPTEHSSAPCSDLRAGETRAQCYVDLILDDGDDVVVVPTVDGAGN